jgi:hypothetical protein
MDKGEHETPPVYGGTLTKGKQDTQADSLPAESGPLSPTGRDRLLGLQWMAFLLEHSADIRRYVEQFQEILLGPPA